MMGDDIDLPRYRCHKEVWALKIKWIIGNTITPDDPGYEPFTLSAAYFEKHQPYAGGYYVVYADGYESFSPADAFEGGYTRCDQSLFHNWLKRDAAWWQFWRPRSGLEGGLILGGLILLAAWAAHSCL